MREADSVRVGDNIDGLKRNSISVFAFYALGHCHYHPWHVTLRNGSLQSWWVPHYVAFEDLSVALLIAFALVTMSISRNLKTFGKLYPTCNNHVSF